MLASFGGVCSSPKREAILGTYVVVQWLRICLAMKVCLNLCSKTGEGIRPHMPQGISPRATAKT